MVQSSDKGNGRFLTLEALAKAKRLPVDFLKELGLHDLPAGGVGMPYYDPTGEPLFVRERESPRCKDKRFYQPYGVPLAAYGQWKLCYGNKAGFLIVVEGESDCWTCWYHKLPALGIPGANVAKQTLLREHVEAVEEIYVLREPGESGDKFVPGVRDRLAVLGFEGKLRELRMPEGVKDPADLHVADPDRFIERMEHAIRAATPLELPKPPERNGRTEAHVATPAKQTIRILDPYRPCPVEALAPPIREFVAHAARALGCDPAYIALPVLAVAASCIGNTRVIRLKRGWDEPCVVWTAIVGDSGTLKSPAYDKAVGYLFNVQERLLREYRTRVSRHEEEMAEHKAAKRQAKDVGKEPGDPPEEPIFARVVCSDTTIEKLAEILEDNPRGTLLAREELAGWFASFQRYKGKAGGTDLPSWLEMHRAGKVIVDRKTGAHQTLFIPRAAVSVTGGIQPGVLARALTADFLDAGLAARLLMAMPPKLAKQWSEVEIAPDVEQAYETALDRLLALDFGKDHRGERAPHALGLSPDGKATWIAFYNEWAQEQAGVEGEMAAAYSKLEAYAARFALLHHVITCIGLQVDDNREVGQRSVEAGVQLCRWFAGESRRIYATLSESAEERDNRRLVEFIRARGGCITVRELQRSNNRKYPGSDQAQAALDAAASAGWGEWIDRPTTERGGQPTRLFQLCTTHDTTDRTPAEAAGPPVSVHDTTADTSSSGPGFSREKQGSVSCVMRHAQSNETPVDGNGDDGFCHASRGSVMHGRNDDTELL